MITTNNLFPENRRQPVDYIQWVDVNKLINNDYNPNFVFTPELKLLKTSLITNGWIHPIIISQDYVIIDGYHRATLTKTDKELYNMTNGLIPAVIMEITPAERIMLTVRINRSKGQHITIKLSDVVKMLIDKYQLTDQEISKGLGMSLDEIHLLSKDSIFKKFDVKNAKFSQSWSINPKSNYYETERGI